MLGTAAYYDKTAAQWADRGYAQDGAIPCLGAFLSLLPPGGRVLDLCCGAGYESQRVRRLGFEAAGLDISAASLAIARERNPDIPFYQGDLLEDYTRLGPVDGILVIAGLVHVETPDLPLAFQRMDEVLRPGGYVLATVREGAGRMEDRSIVEIDGQTYDRHFIAHTLEELTEAAGPRFSCLGELPSDMAVWHSYLFQKPC